MLISKLINNERRFRDLNLNRPRAQYSSPHSGTCSSPMALEARAGFFSPHHTCIPRSCPFSDGRNNNRSANTGGVKITHAS